MYSTNAWHRMYFSFLLLTLLGDLEIWNSTETRGLRFQGKSPDKEMSVEPFPDGENTEAAPCFPDPIFDLSHVLWWCVIGKRRTDGAFHGSSANPGF